MLYLVLDHKKCDFCQKQLQFLFYRTKMRPPPITHSLSLSHTHTHRKGKTTVTIHVSEMVGKPPGQSSQYITFHSTQVIPLRVRQSVLLKSIHTHTHAHTHSMHHFRSLYCIIKNNNNKGNENIAMILLQQWRSEALRAEKTFSGKFGIWQYPCQSSSVKY